jgi:hypothetical protein
MDMMGKRTNDDTRKRHNDHSYVSHSSETSHARQGPTKRLRPMKRAVHFDDHLGLSSSSKPRRTIHNVENVLNLVDKEELWVSQEELLRRVTIIRDQSHHFQQSLHSTENSDTATAYADAFQTLYLKCCHDAQSGEEDCEECYSDLIGTKQCDGKCVNYNSLNFELLCLHRGVEAYCLPAFAVARLALRKTVIQSIVLCDQVLRHHPHRAGLVGAISRPSSMASKRFAHFLGIVDERSVADSFSGTDTTEDLSYSFMC